MKTNWNYPTSLWVGQNRVKDLSNACQNLKKYDKPFKHNTPLIKNKDIVSSGQSEIAKTLEMGPKPIEGDAKKLGKRKKISSEAQRNYLIIPDDYPLLKQRVTLKFKNLDYKETMKLMGKIGEINVLVQTTTFAGF